MKTLAVRPDCKFTATTAKATRDAYWRLGWPTWYVKGPRGATFGPMLRGVLAGETARPLAYRVTAGKRANRATVFTPKPIPTKIETAVSIARYLVAHRDLVRYTQTPSRMMIVRLRIPLPPLRYPIFEDCSSSTTGIYWRSGLPDPNGLGYNGQGYTGTQSAHGRIVWRRGQSLSLLRPGDLLFYGYGAPFHHVTMYLGAGRVFSHGSDAGPYDLPALYRSDAFYARRYA